MTARLGVARSEDGPGQPQDRGHYELRPSPLVKTVLELVWCEPGKTPIVQTTMAEARVPKLAIAVAEYMQRRQQPPAQ